jgi:hypothetical protein
MGNTEGDDNTGSGFSALQSNTTGASNTANGAFALFRNTTGDFNTANGSGALQNNTIGGQNTANGNGALRGNTTGLHNTATGFSALQSNTTGTSNTANGFNALPDNTTGAQNTAIGNSALLSNTTGGLNTAIGDVALRNNTTGDSNIALGVSAGSAVTTADNVICIGFGVTGANVSDTCFIDSIRGVTTQNANAIPVLIDSAGQLGTSSSSARFKKEIKPMDNASATILALNPVTFHYKSDKTSMPQFGLIAEEVAEVNPDLVVHDENGEIYTVRYEAVNAMLLNEFLKEHRTVQELKSNAAKQEATIVKQQKQIDALTAGLQKVSAQLEASKPAPQVVNNP